MEKNIKLNIIRNRAKAIYHNCHSSACFEFSDADSVDPESQEAACHRSRGNAFNEVAGWVKGLIEII